jgi:hypothetical protein
LLRDAKGFEHNAFKIGLARRVIVRALTQAGRLGRRPHLSREPSAPLQPMARHRLKLRNDG